MPIVNPVKLTHWGRVTHICVSNLTIIGSDIGLSPDRRQAIIWTNAGILLIRTLGTNFSEILSEIHAFSFKKMHLKMSSAKWRLFRLGLNELRVVYFYMRRVGPSFLSPCVDWWKGDVTWRIIICGQIWSHSVLQVWVWKCGLYRVMSSLLIL